MAGPVAGAVVGVRSPQIQLITMHDRHMEVSSGYIMSWLWTIIMGWNQHRGGAGARGHEA